MKIKKIEALLKKSKTIILVEAEGNRWIGNSNALYLINDLPQMTKTEILTLCDVPEEKHNEYSFRVFEDIPDITFEDVIKNEYQLSYSEYSICYGGKLYQALTGFNLGVHFIKTEYLNPFSDENFTIHQRSMDNGDTYFAIKKGMFLIGIVLAHKLTGEIFKKWVNDLSEYIDRTKDINEDIQISLFEEE